MSDFILNKYFNSKDFLKNKNKKFDVGFLNGRPSGEHTNSLDYNEGVILYNICKDLKPNIVCEIGTFHGYSAGFMLYALEELEDGYLYTIEAFQEMADISKNNLNKIGNRYEIVVGESKVVDWDKSIDLLFVDGAHSYDGVYNDLVKYGQFVNEGGIILCHDYDHACKQGIDAYFNKYKENYIINILNPQEFHNWLFMAFKKQAIV